MYATGLHQQRRGRRGVGGGAACRARPRVHARNRRSITRNQAVASTSTTARHYRTVPRHVTNVQRPRPTNLQVSACGRRHSAPCAAARGAANRLYTCVLLTPVRRQLSRHPIQNAQQQQQSTGTAVTALRSRATTVKSRCPSITCDTIARQAARWQTARARCGARKRISQ